MTKALGLTAALLLAGCGSTSEPVVNTAPEETVNAATGGNDAAAIVDMNDGERRLTLARAITQADLPCDGVVKAEAVPTQNGQSVWRATCANRRLYTITIQPDGNANILGGGTN